jgi:hypothetical protein
MARLPWQVWFNACVSRDSWSGKRLAERLRSVAERDEPIPPELVKALADLLDPPPGHSGAVLKMVGPRGGSGIDSERQMLMYDDLRAQLMRGDKPYLAVAEVAARYCCSERTVRRLREAVELDLEENPVVDTQ